MTPCWLPISCCACLLHSFLLSFGHAPHLRTYTPGDTTWSQAAGVDSQGAWEAWGAAWVVSDSNDPHRCQLARA